MQIVKTTKIRSPRHLAFVRGHACCITDRNGENCNGTPVVAHHLTITGGRSLSSKPCDSDCVPLCHSMHMELHQMGEETFWEGWDRNPELIADDLASRSPSEAIRNTLRRNDSE